MTTFKRRLWVPLLGLVWSVGAIAPSAAWAGVNVGVSITLAPPELPVYEQPPLPEPGYLWTPGYWAWGPEGYFWVPGTWVRPPRVGYLWTPGYWGWNSGFFVWNAGYWGPHVGFYGGVNYGYGYGGVGYQGGYWRGNNWYYNRAVNRFDDRVHVTNVYERNVTVINNVTVNRVSYNGGRGGINRQPTRDELSAARGPRLAVTPDQRAQERGAARDRSFLATENHGRPAVLATPRPGAFGPRAVGPGAVGAADRSNRSDRPPSAGGRPARVNEPAMRGNDANRAGQNPAQPPRTDRPAQRPSTERRDFPQASPQSRAPERRAPAQRAPEQRAPAQRAPERRGGEQRGPSAQERRGPGERSAPPQGGAQRAPAERGPGERPNAGRDHR